MSKPRVEILETYGADDGELIVLEGVTLRGSEPFNGVFSIFDLDLCVRRDPETGVRTFSVNCQLGDGPYDEESILELELPANAPEPVGIVGGMACDIVRRIAIVA